MSVYALGSVAASGLNELRVDKLISKDGNTTFVENVGGIAQFTGSLTAGTVGNDVVFPTGHVIQVVTDSKSHSGTGIAVSGSGATLTESSGYQLFNTAFTPKYSTSKIIIQTSNILVEETSNAGDWGWLGAWVDSTNVALVYGSPYYSHFSSNLNLGIHSLNHSFDSWGTTEKNMNIRGGCDSAGYILHQPSIYTPTSPSTQTVGLTIMEVMQ